MLLQWESTNDLGETVVHKDPEFDAIAGKAKKNCKKCFSKGYVYYDNGWENVIVFNEELQREVYDRKPIYPRLISCDCVWRRINK